MSLDDAEAGPDSSEAGEYSSGGGELHGSVRDQSWRREKISVPLSLSSKFSVKLKPSNLILLDFHVKEIKSRRRHEEDELQE